ncbi:MULTISPECIES: hypothetical protein [unclassified Pseudoclavibacter]|uniref:hypothetical protein n=1 Tax=unclassified Pseudoclavibacter TaxID=2615177 RepID=UPI001BAC5E54|nr:hypothetical protein [Pseudoclavibacter sp. Marseille-Q4354]MBS3177764.1 hypothetical protein [Pseudoclavibacter sp. Marseille-Q4354]
MGATHVIAAATTGDRVRNQGNALYPDGVLNGLIFPQNHVEFEGRSVTHMVSIRGVVGAPTTWTLEARFLNIIEHSSGPQFGAPEMVPFSELETANFVAGGVAWGKASTPVANLGKNAGEYQAIADHTDNPSSGNILRFSRTVENFSLRHKLQFRFTNVTGGTDPSLVWTYLIQEND